MLDEHLAELTLKRLQEGLIEGFYTIGMQVIVYLLVQLFIDTKVD